ncbi:OsmC family protein [Pseudomonas sp. CC120222-01a]|uniref:OsmC family protein n=1 Tax=Pseudomonas sp. CC120222-01a TaxID=1378075 RepID=UPI000D9EEACE|nr:OsmC family protein [Pseudomonas sp. CC120222-01a]PVZ41189.1 putative OsmC-like protein [Pseudomonas sp. CC120222-01a]
MSQNLNGIDVEALQGFARLVESKAEKGAVRFGVATQWKGGTHSVTEVSSYELGGVKIDRNFEIAVDEPVELLGRNKAANPQELLLAAMNACMTVGYVATAAMMGVTISSLTIKASGMLDLRGFLDLNQQIKPGYDSLDYEVIVEGDGTPEQFSQIHEAVVRTSPNRWNIANAIRLNAKLTINVASNAAEVG